LAISSSSHGSEKRHGLCHEATLNSNPHSGDEIAASARYRLLAELESKAERQRLGLDALPSELADIRRGLERLDFGPPALNCLKKPRAYNGRGDWI
jgi:hypothetical protein